MIQLLNRKIRNVLYIIDAEASGEDILARLAELFTDVDETPM